MTAVDNLIMRPLPDGFINAFSLAGGSAVLMNVADLAAAIGNTAFAQAINNNAYAADVMAEMPDAVANRYAEMSTGYMDASQNDNSELTVGADLIIKRYQEGWEQHFSEGMLIFTANKDTHGGQTCAVPPLLNIFQNRRAAIKRGRNQAGVASTLSVGNERDFALLGSTYLDAFNRRRVAGIDPAIAGAGATASPLVTPTDALRRFEESYLEGTRAVMELTSDDANEFPWNCFGALCKFEPRGDGVDPIAAVAVPGIAESRVCSQFGYPKLNDFCFYMVRKWPRQGLFRDTAFCDSAERGSELLQIRGFSSGDMPHTISGADNTVELHDSYYIDKERVMKTTFMEVGEWDDETDTFRILVREGAQDALDAVPQVVYDAYLSGARIYPVGQYKNRFAVKDTYDQQLAGSMSMAEYNALERITVYNLRRHYK